MTKPSPLWREASAEWKVRHLRKRHKISRPLRSSRADIFQEQTSSSNKSLTRSICSGKTSTLDHGVNTSTDLTQQVIYFAIRRSPASDAAFVTAVVGGPSGLAMFRDPQAGLGAQSSLWSGIKPEDLSVQSLPSNLWLVTGLYAESNLTNGHAAVPHPRQGNREEALGVRFKQTPNRLRAAMQPDDSSSSEDDSHSGGDSSDSDIGINGGRASESAARPIPRNQR